MQCGKPIVLELRNGHPTREVPCGQCMACRINLRRKKTARFLLEALGHERSCFVTLTSDDEHIEYRAGADGAPVWSVEPRTAQLWAKRFNKRVGGGVRYVVVGEYGERTGRPHYHALLFGQDAEEAAGHVEATWRRGQTLSVPLTRERAAYVAGYTAKKLTRPGDPRLDGDQRPEFMRQSLRPPIGFSGLDRLEELHYTRGAARELAEGLDVLAGFRLDGRIWPLDRTMRLHLRNRLGLAKADPRRSGRLERPSVEEAALHRAADSRAERRARRRPRQF